MPIFEEKTLIQSGDSLGNEVIHYPITKVECISDLDDYLATQDFGISDMADAEGILSIQNGGTGNSLGRAVSANSLTTSRTVQTNLASSSSASFNGSANISPGVSGVLPVSNGGTGNSNGSVATLTTARTVRTNLASTSTASFNGSANITPGVTGTLPIANGGTGNTTGSVATLTTSRTVQTNLASSSSASFNGSANISPGVTGTLPISNGGTGNTTGSVATLTTARTVQTNLASSSSASFNGSTDISPGVTGTLPISNGGTGADSISSAISTLTSGLHLAMGSWSSCPGYFSAALGIYANVSNDCSIALGYSANVSGIYSAALGYFSNTIGQQSTALGYYAVATTNNTIQLGNATSLSVLSCRVNITATSDQRDKIDIQDTTKSLEFLNKIRTVTYKFNHRDLYHSDVSSDDTPSFDEKGNPNPIVSSPDDDRKRKIKEKRQKFGIYDYDKEAHAEGSKKGSRGRVGVLAQQVQQAMVEVYGDDNYADLIVDSMYDVDPSEIEDGMENTLAVNSSGFIPFLIDGIKQLSSTIDDLQKRIKLLEGD